MKLLAIDGNQDNLTALRAVVQDARPGCELLTAVNGPQGLELARSADPDVILLDIVMPGMDGFEVCRKLKEDDRLRAIPVIFLTALKTDRESRVKALGIGAEGFLSKPLDEQELVAQVRAMAKLKTANGLHRLEKEQLAILVAGRTRELDEELAGRKRTETALARQLEELRRWQAVTLGREGRIGELKREVNELLKRLGESPRYGSVEAATPEAATPPATGPVHP
jgi:DNA-binding response OmpR family regulator